MASRLFFNGISYSTPTVATKVDDTAMNPTNLTVGNVLALLGTCEGGTPNTVYSFGDPDQVEPVLISGPLCDAAIKAFNPSDDTNAPNLVKVIRVGQATAASGLLKDSGNATSITLTAAPSGVTGNNIRYKLAAGTNPSTLLPTIQLGQDYVSEDNLGGVVFSATYSGASAYADIVVSAASAVLRAGAAAGSAAPIATFAFTKSAVVQDLIDFIGTVPSWTASAGPGANQQSLLNVMDPATTPTKTTPGAFTANRTALVNWINLRASNFVTAGTSGGGVLLPPVAVGWTYLAGGASTPPVLSDWTNALSTLQSEDVQWVSVLTGDQSVWAALDAHVQYMSTTGQKERRALVGPAAGTSMTAVAAMAINLNSDRTSICWPGYYDYDTDGDLVLKDPFYAAACVAAAFAGADPGEPMTNKSFTFRGLETVVRNPTDTDVLIQAGILCFDQETTGYMCVRSISTWLDNDNFNRVEVSTGAATDFAVRNVRQALKVLKGQRGDPRVLGRAITITQSALAALAEPQPSGPGVIVGDAANPAYKNIKASLTGDVVAVTWQMSPVIPVNFVPCTVSITPYSGTASA